MVSPALKRDLRVGVERRVEVSRIGSCEIGVGVSAVISLSGRGDWVSDRYEVMFGCATRDPLADLSPSAAAHLRGHGPGDDRIDARAAADSAS
ncbi:MAG: hypothetical protein ACRDQZ_03020 [Mycobacteriales bacterium]